MWNNNLNLQSQLGIFHRNKFIRLKSLQSFFIDSEQTKSF